jgi:hypothetical protein
MMLSTASFKNKVPHLGGRPADLPAATTGQTFRENQNNQMQYSRHDTLTTIWRRVDDIGPAVASNNCKFWAENGGKCHRAMIRLSIETCRKGHRNGACGKRQGHWPKVAGG